MLIMLDKAKTLTGYSLHSLDGDIGKAKDFYFDDRDWTIRYLVADTGEWLISRQVLISPHSLAGVDRDQGSITVKLTKDQIEHSPTLNRDKPVSRQFERAYFGFYGLPVYFGFEPDRIKAGNSAQTRKKRGDPDLRSAHAVSGHHVEASDGEIGHVEDFLRRPDLGDPLLGRGYEGLAAGQEGPDLSEMDRARQLEREAGRR
jgi:hypothetical protein